MAVVSWLTGSALFRDRGWSKIGRLLTARAAYGKARALMGQVAAVSRRLTLWARLTIKTRNYTPAPSGTG
jgi:hypothetical protein